MVDVYLVAIREQNLVFEVDTFRLWEERLFEFDGNKVVAKMNIISGQDLNVEQRTAWDEIVEITNCFISADRYLFAVLMWNGGISYWLKLYIDIIYQLGLLWWLEVERGYFGLFKNKYATLLLILGAFVFHFLSRVFGVDYHLIYMRDWLNQVGVMNIDEVRFQSIELTVDLEGDFEKVKNALIDLARKYGKL